MIISCETLQWVFALQIAILVIFITNCLFATFNILNIKEDRKQ